MIGRNLISIIRIIEFYFNDLIVLSFEKVTIKDSIYQDIEY